MKPQSRQLHLERFNAAEAADKAMLLKQKGTDDFKRQEWRAAACKYSCGADYARKAGSGAAELLTHLLLNDAQCRLKLSEPAEAARLCSAALERDPENTKVGYGP